MVAQMAQYLVAFEQPDGTYAILHGTTYRTPDDADGLIERLKVRDRLAGMQEPHSYIVIDMPMGWHYGPIDNSR